MGAARADQLARVALAACAFWLTSCGLFGGGGPTTVPLSGRVLRSDTNAPVAGVMITARDEERAFSVSVFSNDQGRYRFPGLYEGTYRIRAQRVGFEPAERKAVEVPGGRASFGLRPTTAIAEQLPAAYFYSLLEWPDTATEANFVRACANCHQIGDHSWRKPRGARDWFGVLLRMDRRGPPLHAKTRELLIPTLMRAFGSAAVQASFEAPAPPEGEVLDAVIWEFEVDSIDKPSCHDLELGADGSVYTEDGYSVHPVTLERRRFGVPDGAHSIERDGQGDMWITVTGVDELVKLDPQTGQVRRFIHPRIGTDKGVYPHTLRFDAQQHIWYTLTASNHVARFDTQTEEIQYFSLPKGTEDPNELSPVPIAYGCDIAPDQSVWWSQLLGPRIGRLDPATGEIRSWVTPHSGPRRLRVAPDGSVWVPFFGEGRFGKFDPKTETWEVYALPTHPPGSELPYALAIHPQTGDVWITGSNSDSLIRFRPETERFTIFPLPTPVSWTREIEFDDEGNVWTCTSNAAIAPNRPGTGRFIKLQLPRRVE